MYIKLDINMLESDQVYKSSDKTATLSFLVSQQYVLLVKRYLTKFNTKFFEPNLLNNVPSYKNGPT